MQSRTLIEILDQPDAWRSVIESIMKEREHLVAYLQEKCHSEVVFIGCGTSYYLALSAANIFSTIAKRKTKAVPSSEVFLFPGSVFPARDNYLAVPISRSGKTTETRWAARYIKENLDIDTLALTCHPSNDLVEICDRSLVATGATEESVVMTKSFTSMLLICVLMARLAESPDIDHDDVTKLPELAESLINSHSDLLREIAADHTLNNFVFLGQGPFYGIACESMLKIKEMAISMSEAYHVLEYRHGPMAIADKNTLVTFFFSNQGMAYEEAVLADVKKLGAKTLVLCDTANKTIKKTADWVVELNSGMPDTVRTLPYMIASHLLSFYRAQAKGINPDNPQHLSQVVMLEG